MPIPTKAADLDLASSLRLAVMRLGRRLRAQRSDESLSLTQLAALATLVHHGAMTPTALADHEKVQPPSMTRVIAALTERGLVARLDHEHDRRQCVISITPAGRTVVLEDRRRRDAWLTRQLAQLTAEERDTLRAAVPLLARVSEA
jgi:DNA-binding MarR family transcriptional regulator